MESLENVGKDTGSVLSRLLSGVFALSRNLSLVKEVLRNFGIRFKLGDFIGESSNTPRFKLRRLLVFFFRVSGTASSTEDDDDVKSRLCRQSLLPGSWSQPQESAGVVGTEKFTKLSLGILEKRELRGRLEHPLFMSGLSLEVKLENKTYVVECVLKHSIVNLMFMQSTEYYDDKKAMNCVK